MVEFKGGEEKLVRESEPIVFENRTDASFDVGMGVVFHKSGTYEVSIVGNITTVSKVTERKTGQWLDNETSFANVARQTCTCSICGRRSVRPLGDFCRWCGADMRTKETDYDYERAVDQLEHDILYEPTFNQDDGSM